MADLPERNIDNDLVPDVMWWGLISLGFGVKVGPHVGLQFRTWRQCVDETEGVGPRDVCFAPDRTR